MSLVVLAPLSAFAATAAYQFIMFMVLTSRLSGVPAHRLQLYLGGYLLTYTYANPEDANGIIKAIHFSLSLLSPVASVVSPVDQYKSRYLHALQTRAGIISVNLFSLLCDGGDSEHVSSSALIGINAYGGPILYLVLQSIALFTLLFWVDSGSVLFQKLKRARAELTATEPERSSKEDVDLEASTASAPSNLLQVLDATKTYGSNTAVDRLSFGVAPGHVFCMVGPNGAGKTTSINMMSWLTAADSVLRSYFPRWQRRPGPWGCADQRCIRRN
jgi:ABC-type multidrug transport system fused ATPase/permease subunit